MNRSIKKVNKSKKWFVIQPANSEYNTSSIYWNIGFQIEELHCADVDRKVNQLQSQGYEKISLNRSFITFSAGVDVQAHLRFPGQSDRETLMGGIESAIAGGYDTVLTMPNTNPFLDHADILKKSIEECNQLIGLTYPSFKVHFSASATNSMRGHEPTDIEALVRAGAKAITDDGWGIQNESVMADVLELCADCDVPFLQHCEAGNHHGVASESAFQKKHCLAIYPRNAESQMLARDIGLLRKNKKARYHVLHVSTKESVMLIEKAKEEGLRITAEVSPHHLYFSNDDIPGEDLTSVTDFKMNPPLFSNEDREILRSALKKGVIDFVSTDHAPHMSDKKSEGWLKAPFGTRGLETTLSVLWTLKDKISLSKTDIEETFSRRPRKFLNSSGASNFREGKVFFDPNESWTVREGDLPGVSKNSCFLGTRLSGKIKFVVNGCDLFEVRTCC